jgi:3-ketosteroid 9alpha-monooxygenase subunit B
MFHSLLVAAIVDETHDAKSFVLEVPPELASDFAYRAGQYLTIEVPQAGGALRRCYSLASSPDHDRQHKVTVKRVHDGRGSNWLHDTIHVGDRLSVSRPEGRFVLDVGAGPLVLFAGGSGITPVISLIKTALATTTRRMTLVYANRDRASIIFADALASLASAHSDRLRIVHRLDDVDGFLDAATVTALAKESPGASVYLCGPAPFMATIEGALLAAGVDESKIHIERFTTSGAAVAEPAPPVAASDTPEHLDVEVQGKKHRIPYVAGKTLLQAARDAGLDAPYSCEEGFCGTCASQLLAGKVTMSADDALSAEEKRKGMILACQARPTTRECAFRFIES